MLAKINKLTEKLKDLSYAIEELAKKPGFFQAQNVINDLIGFLGISAQDSWKLFSDTQGKIRSNATWFMEAEGFADKRAAYKVSEKNDNNAETFEYRGPDADIIVMYRGAYQCFNHDFFIGHDISNLTDMIDTRLSGKNL